MPSCPALFLALTKIGLGKRDVKADPLTFLGVHSMAPIGVARTLAAIVHPSTQNVFPA